MVKTVRLAFIRFFFLLQCCDESISYFDKRENGDEVFTDGFVAKVIGPEKMFAA